jgi:uncharacterized protein YndB with AHSA1/START domain
MNLPMPNLFIERSIEIAVPAIDVWQTFVDPPKSRLAGGEYVTDWDVGGRIAWKGDGGTVGKGCILKLEPGKILKHNLVKDEDGVEAMVSVVTYEFRGRSDGKTTLLARVSFAEAQGAKAFADAGAALDARLAAVKSAAEAAPRG